MLALHSGSWFFVWEYLNVPTAQQPQNVGEWEAAMCKHPKSSDLESFCLEDLEVQQVH